MANGKRIVVDFQNRVADLATRLERSSSKSALLLRDLGTAVAGSTSESDWAHADLYRVLNPERIAANYENMRTSGGWVRWFEFLRNVLVLLPLAVTWLGISFAVRGYEMQIEAEPEQAAQSFIYLWQSGFGDRIWLTLERLAFIDGAILLAVFILTFILYFYSATRANRGRTEATQIQYDLEEILADADLVLSVSRQPDEFLALQRLLKMSDQVLQSLRQESVRFDKFMYERRNELTRLTDFTDQLDRTVLALGRATEELQRVSIEATSAIEKLALPVQILADDATGIGSAVHESRESLEQFVDVRLEQVVGAQLQSIEVLQKQIEQQTASMDIVAGGVPQLVEEVRELRQQLISTLDTISANGQRSQAELVNLAEHIGKG